MRIKITQRLKKKKREIKIEQFKRLIFHNFQKRDHHCDITVTSADGATRYVCNSVVDWQISPNTKSEYSLTLEKLSFQ